MTSSEQPQLSYEEARDELIEIVRRLESGGAPLEESLAEICQHWLDGARARVAAAREGRQDAPDGPQTEPDNGETPPPG
jgi:exodeoxyribonuclease VII small subunit